MVKLSFAHHRENYEKLGVVDMTSVMCIEGKKLYVNLPADLDSYIYDPNETDAEREESRRKFCALLAVIDGFDTIEKELGVDVIFVRNNKYYAARDLFGF